MLALFLSSQRAWPLIWALAVERTSLRSSSSKVVRRNRGNWREWTPPFCRDVNNLISGAPLS